MITLLHRVPLRHALLLAVLMASPAQADPAKQSCDVPAYLLTSESSLPKVKAAVKPDGKLNVLVVGSRSSVIGLSDHSAAYPTRLQTYLSERLPGVTVDVALELQVKKTAEEMAPTLGKLVEDRKPDLVIWQTGTVDAMRQVDGDDFRNALDDGVAAMQKAGTDVILMNLQYSPRTESMISGSAYLDNMRVVAQQHDAPLFDRFAIMRQWNENGDFDLFSPAPGTAGMELAKRVHDCLGRALSAFVIETAHIKTADLRIQR
ncbi:SGNH/GDSL hydrolase family protein [Tardiphaga alba]|uniref:SGNH/GDSL hydrolase family protein n=1 Tax=Tardiphaga alba TaxID=340268 RepID=A0ABX8A2Y2_9BRAD|nr:SGNH/GDSL hydrolase family protein [Tardiphaga alba]